MKKMVINNNLLYLITNKNIKYKNTNKTKTKTQWIDLDHYLTYYKEYHTRYVEPKIQAMSKKKD